MGWGCWLRLTAALVYCLCGRAAADVLGQYERRLVMAADGGTDIYVDIRLFMSYCGLKKRKCDVYLVRSWRHSCR